MKWEYLSAVFTNWPPAGANQMPVQQPLNNRGEAEWELVTMTPHTIKGQYILVFKRPKT